MRPSDAKKQIWDECMRKGMTVEAARRQITRFFEDKWEHEEETIGLRVFRRDFIRPSLTDEEVEQYTRGVAPEEEPRLVPRRWWNRG